MQEIYFGKDVKKKRKKENKKVKKEDKEEGKNKTERTCNEQTTEKKI